MLGSGLAVLLGAQGAPGGIAFLYVNGAMAAARAFFRTLATQGPATAYGQAAADYRTATTLGTLQATAARYDLAAFDDIKWESWSRTGDRALLGGRVDLSGGRDVCATLTMIKDQAGTWRVAALDVRPGPVNWWERSG
ncbi:hypothetical protein Asru_0987_01 [Acidisphaera rubrifaciens HS-AP3]|uniref:DUF4440 domain-containing protein n=2 Tax=Acidisphaera TaxID=50714 RepID=A0A0D6PAX4_9PROT|nr:hypothetical protein Asru_0987_01 [Acidisphaera rubrifaciens HS-AP3]